MSKRVLNVAVFTSQFPYLSETFILDQILGIMKLGHNVQVYSEACPETQGVQPEIAEHDLLRRTNYLTLPGQSRFAAIFQTATSLFRLMLTHPTRMPRVFSSCWPFSTQKRIFLQLMDTVQSQKIDVIHCHYGPNGENAVAAREVLGKQFAIVTSFHGCDMGINRDGQYKSLFCDGDRFIANTTFTKDRIIELGCPVERVAVMPVGVNLEMIPYSQRLKDGRLQRIQLITVARLVEFKALHVAISAVAKLKNRGKQIQYSIIGTGHLAGELNDLVVKLGLENEVTFHGAQTRPEVQTALAKADAFVLPSVEHGGRTETQGLVIQEAQASGLPVVASNIGGIPDGITDGETGLLFPPGDSEALADRVLQLAEDDQLRNRISCQGRTLVETHYDNVQISAQLEQIYLNAMTNKVMSDAHAKGVA